MIRGGKRSAKGTDDLERNLETTTGGGKSKVDEKLPVQGRKSYYGESE